jgi:hypothetical protein
MLTIYKLTVPSIFKIPKEYKNSCKHKFQMKLTLTYLFQIILYKNSTNYKMS